MGDFFKGWRRKIGVVTLLMALVAMGGWIRSQFIGDSMWFDNTFGRLHFGLASTQSDILIASSIDDGSQLRSSFPKFATTEADGFQENLDRQFEWHWRVLGFGHGESIRGLRSPRGFQIWAIPYWSIVIPLTLLTAYLLLAKPRPNKPKKTIEPVPAGGA